MHAFHSDDSKFDRSNWMNGINDENVYASGIRFAYTIPAKSSWFIAWFGRSSNQAFGQSLVARLFLISISIPMPILYSIWGSHKSAWQHWFKRADVENRATSQSFMIKCAICSLSLNVFWILSNSQVLWCSLVATSTDSSIRFVRTLECVSALCVCIELHKRRRDRDQATDKANE